MVVSTNKYFLEKGRVDVILKYFILEKFIWLKDGFRMKFNKIQVKFMERVIIEVNEI